MAKLYFTYSSMNAGKTTSLLQAAYNYDEQGMRPFLLTTAVDDRAGKGVIGSRIGLKREAQTYTGKSNLFELVEAEHKSNQIICVFVDEAQFLTDDQVWELAGVVDKLGIPVMCYGLRTDFQGSLFSGSKRLLAVADVLREARTVCHCGKNATMVLRVDSGGNPVKAGPQLQIGGNDAYKPVCRKHWKEAFEN